jgi:predicted dinucleotide-binding enzyme
MKIGIIGAANVGPELAKKFVARGHQVSIANSRGPETLAAVAVETGAIPVTLEKVVQDKDIIVVTIPEASIPKLPKDLFASAGENTIVVDTGNYYPDVKDSRIPAIDNGMLESAWVSQQLGVPVIKAFNSITVWSLKACGLPAGTLGRICISVAGDNTKHKKVVIALVDQTGFDGIDGGALAESWRQQPGAPAYCNDLDRDALSAALQQAEFNKVDEYRAKAMAAAVKAVEEAGSLEAATSGAGKPKK